MFILQLHKAKGSAARLLGSSGTAEPSLQCGGSLQHLAQEHHEGIQTVREIGAYYV